MTSKGTAVAKRAEPPFPPLPLDTLARDINKHYRLAKKHSEISFEHVIAVGERLVQAKKQVGHGEWLTWISENLEIGVRQVQSYMKLAAMPEANAKRVAHLPMREAIASTAKPKAKPPVEGSAEYERDRKECVALNQKVLDAERELAHAHTTTMVLTEPWTGKAGLEAFRVEKGDPTLTAEDMAKDAYGCDCDDVDTCEGCERPGWHWHQAKKRKAEIEAALAANRKAMDEGSWQELAKVMVGLGSDRSGKRRAAHAAANKILQPIGWCLFKADLDACIAETAASQKPQDGQNDVAMDDGTSENLDREKVKEEAAAEMQARLRT